MEPYKLSREIGMDRKFGDGMKVVSKLEELQGKKKDLGPRALKRLEQRAAEAKRREAWRAKRARKRKHEKN